MKKVIIGAVVGAVALFAWQYAAWELLGLHELDPEPVLAQEAAVVQALQGTARGIYGIPGITTADYKDKESDAYKAWVEKHKDGPRAFVVYDPEGSDPMGPKMMATGGVINLLMVLVVAMMLRSAGFRSVFGRILFVVGFGVFLALAMDAQGWNWMNHPFDWTKAMVIDHVGGMAIVGVLLGLIVKPG